MNILWQDLRYAVRMLLKRPGFTLIAITALALGIGANTAIFSVVNTVLLRGLPYSQPARLTILWAKQQSIEQESPSYPDYLDWKKLNRSFEGMAVARRDNFTLTGSGDAERLIGREVSADFFSVLGVKPQGGRFFLAEEDRTGAAPVVVISNDLWQRRFNRDPGLIGRTIELNEKQFTVIGVLPADFQFYTPADVFAPIEQTIPERLKDAREEHGAVIVIGRLRTGVTAEQALSEMNGIALNLERQYPKTNTTSRVSIRSIREDMVGGVRSSLLILFGAVGFVLLIACVNVANLMLVAATSRQREISIRLSLGAGRGRIIRQMISESLLLALTGGACGLLLAVWCKDVLLAAVANEIPSVKEIFLDPVVFGFSFGLSVLTGVVFGSIPAILASRPDLNDSLKEGGSTGFSRRSSRAGKSLVVLEIALGCVLLAGAGLMIRSFQLVSRIDSGFNPRNVLTMRVSLPPLRYQEAPRIRNFYKELQRRLEGVPGVQAAAFSTSIPLGNSAVTGVLTDPHDFKNYGEQNLTVQSSVGKEYFRSMEIPIIRGRSFSDQDTDKTQLVAVIDDHMAAELFAENDPIGRHIYLDEGRIDMQVVGIAKHIKHLSFDADDQSKVRFQMYSPYSQVPDQYVQIVMQNMNLVVRTAGDPLKMAVAVRNEVSNADQDLPVYEVRSMEQIIDGVTAKRRFSTMLLGFLGAVALILAAIGVYGVMAHAVSQRTKEIGLRMALGARASEVMRLVLEQGMAPSLLGLLIGILSSLALTRLLSGLLYNVSPTDPITFLGIALIIASVALAACFLPARRAAKVDPMAALRSE